MILAFDQSPTSTGWALLDGENDEVVVYGIIGNEKDLAREGGHRALSMGQKISHIIQVSAPSVVVIEDVVLQRSPAVTKELSQLQGVILGYCAAKNVAFAVLYPTTWRKKLSFKQGKGVKRKELKEQAKTYVKRHYHIEQELPEDVCDAICIAAAYTAEEKGEK